MGITMRETISGAMQVLGMLVGFLTVPLLTPILIWVTLAADLPLMMVTFLLVSMTVISNCLSHITVRICTLGKVSSHNQPYGGPRPPSGAFIFRGD